MSKIHNNNKTGSSGSSTSRPVLIADGQYVVEKEIGKGSFATVYRGHIANDNTSHIAVKAVARSKLKNKKLLENLEIEIAILKKIKHNHIVSLIDCERTSTDFYLIMEYCALGDLTFLIKKRKELIQNHPLLQKVFEKYPPPNENHNGLNHAFILNYLQQLSSALKFLRSKNLVHRDIKPQNLLLSTPLINYTDSKSFHDLGFVGIYNLPILKIADFGFARFLPNSSLAETLCGSPLYMAPEILNYQKYNAKADLWSVGTVLFEMCCGHPPFKASNHLELYKKIKRANDHITFPSYLDKFNSGEDSCSDIESDESIIEDETYFHEINGSLMELICRLLTFDPQERIGFEEFFNNKLVNMDLSRYELNDTNSNVLESKSKDILESNMFISEFLSPHRANEILNDNKMKTIKTNNKYSLANKYITSPRDQQHPFASDLQPLTTVPRYNQAFPNDTNNTQNSDIMLEKEYVVVEKKSVEVNELADEFAKLGNNETFTKQQLEKEKDFQQLQIQNTQNPTRQYSDSLVTERTTRRTSSNNSNSSRRASLIDRRLSITSLNPSNALSRALGIASVRLFGGANTQQTQQQHKLSSSPINKHSSIFNSELFQDLTEKLILRINDEVKTQEINQITSSLNESLIKNLKNNEIVSILEILTAKAFVIYSYAEVKYSQIIPLGSHHNESSTTPSPGKRLSTGSCAIEDEEEEENIENRIDIDDGDKILYKEAITLYLKSLEILSKSMKVTSIWWFNSVEKKQNGFSSCSLRLNLLVQWIREKFNECLSKAESLRIKLVEQNLNGETDDIYIEKLLYDRALDISKNSAKMELSGQNLSICELSYATSLWMLEVALDNKYEVEDTTGIEATSIHSSILDEEDRKIIKKYIDSIAKRLKSLRQKIISDYTIQNEN